MIKMIKNGPSGLALLLGLGLHVSPVLADTAPQSLPFMQNWSNTGLITVNDSWSGVPGIVGYLGDIDAVGAVTGVDPQTLTQANSGAVDVIANQNSPNTNNSGGVAEFEIADPVVALQGSGTADAPSLVLHLNTSGQSNITVAYTLRDVDGAVDNAIQPMALQYRVGSSGDFINVPAAFAADASSGPSLATLVTPVSATLPVAANNQPEVQVRILTTNAVGSDEWIGVDDISVTAGGGPVQPSVSLGLTPASFSELGGSTTVTATLSATSASVVTVNLGFGGTATNGTIGSLPDYSASASSISIPAGMLSGNLVLSSNDDALFEGNETIVVSLGALTNATAGTPNSVTATITENDVAPPPMAGARIYQIQGATHRSTMNAMGVTNVPGIVTALSSNGFYMQDADGDNNTATSDGIFVFTSTTPTATVGQSVLVNGTIEEFRPGGAATNLTVTEIVSPSFTSFSGSLFTNTTISPTVIGNGGRVPPNAIIDNDSAGNVETSATHIFDPAQDGLDFYESLEGMLVAVNNGRVTGPRNSFGEIWVVGDNGANASGSNARGGITLVERATGVDFNPERIQLDDGVGSSTPTVNVGDVINNIRGVVHYDFGNFEVRLTQTPAVTVNPLPASVRTITVGGDRLSIGAYNVENLDPSDTSFARLAGQIVTNMGAPDILALSEVQDNNGATNDSVVAANTTLSLLTAAIVTAGGPSYTCAQIDPVDDQDGGEPGGNIRVVQCYNAARVSFVPGTVGIGGALDATQGILSTGKLALTLSPGRIAPMDGAWMSSRKPLAAAYEFRGRRVVIVNVHFNSKGGDQPLFGVNQPPTLTSETQRRQQATLVHTFVNSLLTLDAGARVVVLGDLNDFDFSPPLRILRKGPLGAGGIDGTLDTLRNLGTELIVNETERYSYVFEGNSQELDHILATVPLRNAAAQYQTLHINSEYADQASDHDALVSSFLLPANVAPTANAGADRSVAASSAVTLASTGSADSDGSIASFAWTQTAGTAVTLSNANTATASFTAPAAAATLTFRLTVTDNEGVTGTDEVTITVTADITPDAFSFTPATNVAAGSLQTSNAITVGGINASAPISVTGGFYGVNGGPCTQTSGTVNNGQSVVVCHTAASAASTMTSTTLTIGANGVLTGVSATFTSTTAAAPPPDDDDDDDGGGAFGAGLALLLLALARRVWPARLR